MRSVGFDEPEAGGVRKKTGRIVRRSSVPDLAQQGLAPDCLQRPLLRHSRFQQQVKPGVGRPTPSAPGSRSSRSTFVSPPITY